MGFRQKRGSPFASEHREGIPQLALLANITLRQQNIAFRRGKYPWELHNFLQRPFGSLRIRHFFPFQRGRIAEKQQISLVKGRIVPISAVRIDF